MVNQLFQKFRIESFQSFAGLNPSGELDNETLELMKTPRCGKEDRVADFVLHGRNWNKKILSYRILQYPSSGMLSKCDIDQETRKAFSMWEEASGLKFQEKTSGSTDIKIKFVKFDHGDGSSFDGPGSHILSTMEVMLILMTLKTGV